MKTIKAEEVKRHGNHIRLGQGRTAIEGSDGLKTLRIRESGKIIKSMRGSSLEFGEKLSQEDREYLASLGSDD